MFTLTKYQNNQKEMRMAVVDTLTALMKENSTIIALEADLGGASGFTKIKKMYPKQFINVGIAEANMVGVAAGLYMSGWIPFIHTFGPFATRRVFDQLYISGAYAHTTINIYGSDPGFTAGPNGGTHTTWEDVALMRMIPNSIVCDAADNVQMEWIIREFAKLEGIHYVRGNRKAVKAVYSENATFELGKGNIIKTGTDVLLVVAGQLVRDAIDAATELETRGISVEIIDMFTIKPIDETLILKECKHKKAIITLENHSITGGLGSAVAEILASYNCGTTLYRMGVSEKFGEVGTQSYLQAKFGLSKEHIIETILKVTSN